MICFGTRILRLDPQAGMSPTELREEKEIRLLQAGKREKEEMTEQVEKISDN